MRIEIAYITPRRGRLKSGSAQALLDEYLARINRYTAVQAVPYDSEASFLSALDKATARTSPALIALDSRGDALTSEAIATRFAQLRDGGTQQLIFAIGPANGWSSLALGRAKLRLSFGAITLPHELALVVLAEQLYRAQTILEGHPYHGGHA